MDDMPDPEVEDDVDAEIDVDESLEDDALEDEDGEEASLDDLYETEMVAEEAAAGATEDEDEFLAKVLENPADDPTEALAFKVRPKADGEFQCQSCFLIKQSAQLADDKRMWCVDCV